MQEKIYIFSGLGADERVFRYIDFKDHEPVFIKWIIPKEKESIEAYTKRISAQMTTENPLVIGLSFGGIIAIELAKQVKIKKLILLSTAKTKEEIPGLYKLIGKLGILKIIPASLLKQPNFIAHYLFGTKSKEEKKALNDILKETDPVYLKWAIERIFKWKNQEIPVSYIHIHGTKDRILPFHEKAVDVKIQNGGHFMILNKFEEINEVLEKEFVD